MELTWNADGGGRLRPSWKAGGSRRASVSLVDTLRVALVALVAALTTLMIVAMLLMP